jgi:uncharacterized repeat protein (TIGR01451 family)
MGRWVMASVRVVVVALLVVILLGGSAVASQPDDWPGYLFDAGHSSSTSDAVITIGSAGTLRMAWSFTAAGPTMAGQPSQTFFASPTVADGRVFIGANTGVFYALDESTGAVLWQRFLGFQPTFTCAGIGLVSTAAVTTDSATGADTVYVAGGDGYLYALNAADGSVLWRSVVWQLPSASASDYFNWSSPVVSGGEVYIGASANCDNPFVPAGAQAFNATTGSLDATWQSVPDGSGGGVWTSPAVSSSGDVFVTTGSGPAPPAPQGEMYSIVRLAGGTLNQLDAWTVPASARSGDADFASSPTLFSADLGDGTQTAMVTACNKNGILYSWQQNNLSAGPVWHYKVGLGTAQGTKACLPAPIWDGSHLLVAGNPTSIAGIAFAGSLQELSPSTGQAQWRTGLGGTILGSPTLNGAGVLAAGTYSTPVGTTQGTYLVNAADGTILNFLPTTSLAFSQPVFAGQYLLVANGRGVLTAYTPATSGDTTTPTTPQGLQAARSSDGTQASLTWIPSTDDVAVSRYQIYRDSGLIASVVGTLTSYTDATARASTAYTYQVQAVDTSGNASPLTPPITSPPPTGLPVFSDGFESGSFSDWTSTYGTIKVQNQYVDTGSFAALASSTGPTKAKADKLLPGDYSDLYAKIRFDVVSQATTNNVDLLHLLTDQSAGLATISLSPKGELTLRNDTLAALTRSGVAPTKGVWHTLELELKVNGSSSQTNVWLDGAILTKLTTTANYGTTPIGVLEIGDAHTNRAYTVAYDNAAADTSLLPPSNLSVTQAPSASAITADSPLSFTITVTNTTNVDETNATLTDALPASAIVGTVTPSQGSCSGTTTTLSCTFGTLAAGASAAVTVSMTPILPGTITNQAAASADQSTTPTPSSSSVTVTAASGISYVKITDTGFSPTTSTAIQGGTVQWDFLTPASQPHQAADNSGMGLFDTGTVSAVNFTQTTFSAAGHYPVIDPTTGHTATVNIKLLLPSAGNVNQPFTVTWASTNPPTGYCEDIQVMTPGQTSFSTWHSKQLGTAGQYTPATAGTFQFRARLRNLNNARYSSYSPTASITIT